MFEQKASKRNELKELVANMCSYNCLLLLWLLLTFLCAVSGSTDDWSICPAFCRCKWISGKKSAECSKGNLTAIPTLHADIQSLDLSLNNIPVLPANAFQQVGLVNLHKIVLEKCGIKVLDKDAFRGLQILIELDLSSNNIHKIHADTFIETFRLRVLHLNHNPLQALENGLFFNLTFLTLIDVSNCNMNSIDLETFKHVPNITTLKLNSNQLTRVNLCSFESMTKLSSLDLSFNPWNCDCHLRDFRDWTISRNLYSQPTMCAEPLRLRNKSWDSIGSEDFACKPEILYPPPETNIQASGEVTLSCKIQGDPSQNMYWVHGSSVINNSLRNPHYEIKTSSPDGGKYESWYNLTISNMRSDDKGVYTCAARSPAGLAERNITLEVLKITNPITPSSDALWISVVIFFLLVLVLLLLVVLFFRYCKYRKTASDLNPKKSVNVGLSPNGDISHHIGANSEQEKRLLTEINPVQKPPRRYDNQPSVNGTIELSELEQNLLDDTSSGFGGNTAAENENRKLEFPEGSFEESQDSISDSDYMRARSIKMLPPDLLFSTMRGDQRSPAESCASTVAENAKLYNHASPVNSHPYSGFGTLPYSRSQSPFSPSSAGTPVIFPRQGYVTIPRRPPNASWSAATTPSLSEDPHLKAEPVYDNLGRRTAASGSLASIPEISNIYRALPLNSVHTSPTKTKTSTPNYSMPQELDVQRRSSASPALKFSEEYNSGAIKPLPLSLSSNDRISTLPPTLERRVGSWSRTPSESLSSLNHFGPIENSVSSARRTSVPTPPLSGTLTRSKVPPKPPPKPKKKTGPLFEDEDEDGTEV